MRDELLLYYERELTYLRQLAMQFSEKYPKVASRLVLEPTKCEDPHVERLLEAFAFLAARVHLKLDDEFPEVTEALLSVAYPHLIRPVPSMSIVQFELDPEQGKLSTGLPIGRDAVLYSRPVGGVPCIFRTCYDVVLWPVSIAAAEWRTPDRLQPAIKAADSAAALRLELNSSPDVKLPQLGIDRLRFHLSGESSLVHTLYEALGANLTRIVVRDPTNTRLKPVTLPASCLRPVGFAENEGVLPYARRSFLGYRLLEEYFAFPEKFFFFDLTGLAEVWPAGFKERAELIFLISDVEGEERRQRLELGVSAGTFRLATTPVINLFPQTAEPILLTQQKYEYPVVPDVRRPNSTEIYSIDEVASIDAQTQQKITYEPFYSFRHGGQRDKQKCFWLATRRASNRVDDEATDMFLSLVDLSTRPTRPDADTLTVRTTCTNRDLPSRLPFGSAEGDFEMEGMSAIKRISALKKPTPTLRPPAGKGALWRLISHLSLNYLSLVEDGKDSLQQILKLYEFTNTAFSQKVIEGIVGVKSHPHFARVISEHGITFARGTRVELELDENQFVGGGVYLFASVLEHFLAQYASLNSFSQLVATTRQRKEALREWPPRAGRKILM
jgi:type VI secretion system protein ImpG